MSAKFDYETMGDPHLGRRFKTGVPLHRMGEREELVWRDFRHGIETATSKFHICMGDLFDKAIVPPEVVIRAAQIYAAGNPSTTYIILRGNHDASKDATKKSSFDLFKLLVKPMNNILVVEETVVSGKVGFIPYDPFLTASEQVLALPDDLDLVFMHHDYQDWGGDYVIPTQLLADKGITQVVNGHDHLARVEKRHGVTVTLTGSLQPFTHAEDDTGEWYVTTSLACLPEIDVRNKNVRILLSEGESLPAEMDCLSITAKRVTEDEEGLEVDTSEFESLDLKDLLAKALGDLSIKDQLMEVFQNDHASVS